VLEQIGVAGRSAFRVGLGPTTTADDVEDFASSLPVIIDELRHVERISADAMARFHPPPSS
jgi:cysteine sulfinate desulfinase/cysteine desulfurase-like protein